MPVLELYPFTSTKIGTFNARNLEKNIFQHYHIDIESHAHLYTWAYITRQLFYQHSSYGSLIIDIKTCILTASKSRAVRKGEESLWMSHAESHDVSDGDVLNMRRISKIIPDDLDVVSII